MVLVVLFTFVPVTFTGFFTICTSIVHSAVFLPSFVVTVIFVVPFPTAVTFPFASTTATFLFLDFQVTVLFDAFFGNTAALSFTEAPFADKTALFCASLTPVTFTTGSGMLTVTLQTAVFPPSSVVTIISAEPLAAAFTSPFWSTVTDFVLVGWKEF